MTVPKPSTCGSKKVTVVGITHSDVRYTPPLTQELNPGANEDGAKGSRQEQKDGGKSKQDRFIPTALDLTDGTRSAALTVIRLYHFYISVSSVNKCLGDCCTSTLNKPCGLKILV